MRGDPGRRRGGQSTGGRPARHGVHCCAMREFDLLRYIYDATAPAARHVLIGPGDDMAMVRLGSRHLLAAVDQLVAGRHVDLAATPLELVGRKAIARSLSDVAAMAGTPVASLVVLMEVTLSRV